MMIDLSGSLPERINEERFELVKRKIGPDGVRLYRVLHQLVVDEVSQVDIDALAKKAGMTKGKMVGKVLDRLVSVGLVHTDLVSHAWE